MALGWYGPTRKNPEDLNREVFDRQSGQGASVEDERKRFSKISLKRQKKRILSNLEAHSKIKTQTTRKTLPSWISMKKRLKGV